MEDKSLIVGVASRPYPGEVENGDACSIDWHGRICRIALVDGLGHGPPAAAAAEIACRVLKTSPELGAVEALLRCHAALAGTRGAAVGIAYVDVDGQRVTYAGVGNIEGHLCATKSTRRFLCDRGIVGVVMPRIHPVEYPLAAPWWLALHTDGIHSHFTCEALSAADSDDPHILAPLMLADWSRSTDDSTIVIARPTTRVDESEGRARSASG